MNKLKKINDYICITSEIVLISLFISSFIASPNISKSLSVYNQIKSLKVDDIENITIIDEKRIYTRITNTTTAFKIINSIKQFKKTNLNHPSYQEQYLLTFFLKNKTKIALKSIRLKDNKSIMQMLVNQKDKNNIIGSFENEKLFETLKNVTNEMEN